MVLAACSPGVTRSRTRKEQDLRRPNANTFSFSFLFLRFEFGCVDSLKVFEALSFLSDRWPSHIFCRQSYCEFYFYFFVFKMRTVRDLRRGKNGESKDERMFRKETKTKLELQSTTHLVKLAVSAEKRTRSCRAFFVFSRYFLRLESRGKAKSVLIHWNISRSFVCF